MRQGQVYTCARRKRIDERSTQEKTAADTAFTGSLYSRRWRRRRRCVRSVSEHDASRVLRSIRLAGLSRCSRTGQKNGPVGKDGNEVLAQTQRESPASQHRREHDGHVCESIPPVPRKVRRVGFTKLGAKTMPHDPTHSGPCWSQDSTQTKCKVADPRATLLSVGGSRGNQTASSNTRRDRPMVGRLRSTIKALQSDTYPTAKVVACPNHVCLQHGVADRYRRAVGKDNAGCRWMAQCAGENPEGAPERLGVLLQRAGKKCDRIDMALRIVADLPLAHGRQAGKARCPAGRAEESLGGSWNSAKTQRLPRDAACVPGLGRLPERDRRAFYCRACGSRRCATGALHESSHDRARVSRHTPAAGSVHGRQGPDASAWFLITTWKGGPLMIRCVECHELVDEAAAVALTERSAMCAECHAEAMRACQQERMEGGLALYCPAPKELWRRIEAVRDSIGDSPRSDQRPIGRALVGTMLYVPQPSRVAAATRAQERMGAA